MGRAGVLSSVSVDLPEKKLRSHRRYDTYIYIYIGNLLDIF